MKKTVTIEPQYIERKVIQDMIDEICSFVDEYDVVEKTITITFEIEE